MSEDKFRDVDLLRRVHLDGNTASIVVHRDCVVLGVDGDLDSVHVGVVNLTGGHVQHACVHC